MGTDKRQGKLFEEYANPDKLGKSAWKDVVDMPEKYKELKVTNGSSYSRNKSYLQEKYIVLKEYNGRKLVKIKLDGFR